MSITRVRGNRLRGESVSFVFNGRTLHGCVITHIRDGRWMVEARYLPKEYERGAGSWTCRRIVLARDEFTVKSKLPQMIK